MAIQNDITVYPYSKTIRHTSGTTVYSAVAFYSFLMDLFDEPGYLTYQTPIRFNTPTSFTMLNGWFLDDGDGSNILQYITGGGIDTLGYSTISDPVYMLDMDNAPTSWVNFVSTDKDKDITDDATAVGPLLQYKNNYPTANTGRIWVRDTRGVPAAIADGSAIGVTGGTGAGTANGASASGDNIYHNLFSLAAFPGTPDPQIYVYQQHPADPTQRIRISEWSAFTNWDRGSFDILFPVQLAGTLIDSGDVSTFVRQTGDLFTFVESTLNTAGRTPIALETSSDNVNVDIGEHYLLYDAEQNGGFAAGDVIQNVATNSGTPPSWYAEVVSVVDNGTAGYLVLRGLRESTVIADNDAIFVGTTQRGLANGTPGDTLLEYTGGTDFTTAGQVLTGGTSGATRLQRGVDTTNDRVVCQVDSTLTGTNRNSEYITFTSGETVTGATTGSAVLDQDSTTLISGFSDVTIAHICGSVTISGKAGTFQLGERVTWNAGASEAIYVADNGTSMTLANVDPTDEPDAADVFTGDVSGATANCDSGLTDGNTYPFAFPLQSTANYSVVIQGGSLYNAGRNLKQVYQYAQYYLRDGQDINTRTIYTSNGTAITPLAAEEYIKADPTYAATKPAPYGTLAGTLFFGAQGVWVTGLSAGQDNELRLSDSTNTLQQAFVTVNVTITNTRADDRVAVFPNDGSGNINTTQYTSHATNNVQSGSIFDVVASFGAFPNDTPTSGTFFVVDNALNETHRYRYDSFNATGGVGTDGRLVLPTETTGTATGGTTLQTLIDSGASFGVGDDVQVGDIIRRTTDSAWAYVTAVTSTTQIETTLLSDGSAWASADTYEINSLIQTYDASDTFYITYMDFIEDTGTAGSPGSQTVQLTFVQSRSVVIEARNQEAITKIIPFSTTSTITSTGLSLGIVRNTDTVAV